MVQEELVQDAMRDGAGTRMSGLSVLSTGKELLRRTLHRQQRWGRREVRQEEGETDTQNQTKINNKSILMA